MAEDQGEQYAQMEYSAYFVSLAFFAILPPLLFFVLLNPLALHLSMSNPNLSSESSRLTAADKEFENNIRPSQIAEFSGQSQAIENLMVLPDWERLHFPGSWRMNWGLPLKKLRGL